MSSFLSKIAKLSNTAKLSLLVSVLLLGAIGVTIYSSKTKQEVRSHAQQGDAETSAGDAEAGTGQGETGQSGSSPGESSSNGGFSDDFGSSNAGHEGGNPGAGPGGNGGGGAPAPGEGSQDTGTDENIPGGGYCIGSCPASGSGTQQQAGSGIIILKAIIDGVDTRMDVNVDYCAPRPEGCHTGAIASTGVYQNVPVGTYGILKVISPPALAFIGFSECGGSIISCSQGLHAGDTLTFTLNYHQVGSGIVNLAATLDGNHLPEGAILNLHYIYPLGFGDADISFPSNFPGTPTGVYTLEYNSGGPPGATFAGIDSGNSTCKTTRTCSQVLRASSAITFIYRFKSQGVQVHSVVSQTSDQNNFIQQTYNNIVQWVTGSTHN